MDLIDRQDLVAAICHKADGVSNHFCDVALDRLYAMDGLSVLQCIAEAPSISKPEAMTIERRRGGHIYVQCGDCNADITDGVLYEAIKFCPYCGSHLSY